MKVVTEQIARHNISANLKRIIGDRGITQRALARMAGENDVAISRVIRGTNTPTVTLLSHIAEALDVSMDRLLSTPPKNNLSKSA